MYSDSDHRTGAVSVVVPCFNEEAVLHETHRRLTGVLERLNADGFEIIYVDDGSRDRTAAVLRDIQESDARVRAIRLSRNFGHQVAVSAGMEHAAGDAVVIIDADLQDPPEAIPEMVARWRDGYHVVYGVRTDRPGESWFKLWTARAFYRLLNRLSEVPIPLDSGDFRLLDRKVVETLRAMPERDRYVRGMVSWAGFRQVAILYERAPRFAGESKYPLAKMLQLAFDGIVSFSKAPLRVATWFGLLALVTAVLGIVAGLGVWLFTDGWVPGWAPTFIAVLFLGGIQLLAIGLLGEYAARTYGEAKRRPLYIVEERLGLPEDLVAARRQQTERRQVQADRRRAESRLEVYR